MADDLSIFDDRNAVIGYRYRSRRINLNLLDSVLIDGHNHPKVPTARRTLAPDFFGQIPVRDGHPFPRVCPFAIRPCRRFCTGVQECNQRVIEDQIAVPVYSGDIASGLLAYYFMTTSYLTPRRSYSSQSRSRMSSLFFSVNSSPSCGGSYFSIELTWIARLIFRPIARNRFSPCAHFLRR